MSKRKYPASTYLIINTEFGLKITLNDIRFDCMIIKSFVTQK